MRNVVPDGARCPNCMDGKANYPDPTPSGVLAQLIASALDAVWVVDEHDIIEYLNPAAVELCGYPAEELLGVPISRILPREVAGDHAEFLRAHIDGDGPAQVLGRVRELSIVTRGGRIVPVEVKAFEIAGIGGKRRFGAMMRDITERRQAEARQRRLVEKLQRMASKDELTGLPNRRAFFDTLDRTVAAARRHRRPACIAVVDIDLFKRVNDRHGHDAGDRALAAIAGILSASMRTEDMVARIGGEEFAFLLPDTDLQAAYGAIERMQDNVRQTPIILANGAALSITVSAGVAALDPDQDGAADLRTADAALLRAKQTGRDRICIADDEPDEQSAAG